MREIYTLTTFLSADVCKWQIDDSCSAKWLVKIMYLKKISMKLNK